MINLVMYLTGVMHLDIADATNAITNFLGTSSVAAFFLAYLADSYIGRCRTLGLGMCIALSVCITTSMIQLNICIEPWTVTYVIYFQAKSLKPLRTYDSSCNYYIEELEVLRPKESNLCTSINTDCPSHRPSALSLKGHWNVCSFLISRAKGNGPMS